MPKTVGALEKYLSGGIIKGIGPATAKKIIDAFGEETIAIFKYEPEKLSRIKEGTKSALFIALGISLATILILSLYDKELVSMFMQEPNQGVINLACEYLNVIMFSAIFLGILMVYRHTLQGMGSVMAPLASGIAELIARALGAIILGYYFGYSGICFATPLAWIFGSIVLFIGYRISLLKHYKTLRVK